MARGRQPGRRAGAPRPARRGRRRDVRGHGRGPRPGPRRGLRQPPGRQRGRDPRGCRALARGARAEPARPRLEPGRHPVRQRDPQPRPRRDRVRGGRGGRAACWAGSSWSSRPAATSSSPIPAYQATASYAMWSGDLADARRAAERGWARLRGTEDWVLVARMAATALEVESAIVAEALERRRIGDVAASRERASRILAEAEAAVARARSEDGRRDRRARGEPRHGPRLPRPPHRPRRSRPLGGPRRALAGHRRPVPRGPGPLAPGRGHHGRRHRGPGRRARPHRRPPRARRRPRAAARRGDARDGPRAPGRSCAACASSPAARSSPCRRRWTRSSTEPAAAPIGPRAQVAPGPVADDEPAAQPCAAGRGRRRPATRSGCPSASWRSSALIAQGRTNREIGDRLFISQKTVGVHVGNILAKLGVSGRVEAAAVAIRLGLESGGRRVADRLTRPLGPVGGMSGAHSVDSAHSTPARTSRSPCAARCSS